MKSENIEITKAIEQLKNPDEEIRQNAYNCLKRFAKMRLIKETHVNNIIRLIKNSNNNIRLTIIDCLIMFAKIGIKLNDTHINTIFQLPITLKNHNNDVKDKLIDCLKVLAEERLIKDKGILILLDFCNPRIFDTPFDKKEKNKKKNRSEINMTENTTEKDNVLKQDKRLNDYTLSFVVFRDGYYIAKKMEFEESELMRFRGYLI